MHQVVPHPIADLLVNNVTRELVLSVEENLVAAALRGGALGSDLDSGHRAHAVGQMRHFHMNQAFRQALEAAGAAPTPIRGNSVVVGRAGIFQLSRFNLANGAWNNCRRSITRRQLAEANAAIEMEVRPSLFEATPIATEATAFFVATFSGFLGNHPEAPQRIDIAVPDQTMTSWLFREPLVRFVERYSAAPQQQVDLAVPTLKTGSRQIKDQGT